MNPTSSAATIVVVDHTTGYYNRSLIIALYPIMSKSFYSSSSTCPYLSEITVFLSRFLVTWGIRDIEGINSICVPGGGGGPRLLPLDR